MTWNSADYTAANGTNHSGNGQCAMFDPRGGGMIWKKVPNESLSNPASGQFVTTHGASTDAQLTLLAGYPIFFGKWCIYGTGTCNYTYGGTSTKPDLAYKITYLNLDTCRQINRILGISWDAAGIEDADDYWYSNLFNNTQTADGATTYGAGFFGKPGVAEGCANEYWVDNHWSNVVYTYMCPLMIR